MADPEDLCPTCHSKISQSGTRVKDGDGSGTPAWSHDPILTPDMDPLNGPSYRGTQFFAVSDIVELQENRRAWESSLGITPPTEFSDVALFSTLGLEAHIVELRISTERILAELGASLEDYFSLDADGVPQAPGPNDVAKSEWTDVARGAGFNTLGLNSSIVTLDGTQFLAPSLTAVPGLPVNTFIRGIHIEDLRHPFPAQVEDWIEVFAAATPVTLSNPLTCVRTFTTCKNELIINGDVHDYRLRTAITANTTNLTLIPPATSTIVVSPNVLFNGESNSVYCDMHASYVRTDIGGGLGQNTDARAVIIGQSGTLHKSPRKLDATTQLELFLDYTFNGARQSPGTIPPPIQGVQRPDLFFNVPSSLTLSARFYSPAQFTPVFSMSFLMQIYQTSFQGPFIQYTETKASHPSFADVINTSVNFVTISDVDDQFNGQSAIVIPFAPFIHMFNTAVDHTFIMSNVEATVNGDAQNAFYLSDRFLPPSSSSTHVTVTLNGYRIREV